MMHLRTRKLSTLQPTADRWLWAGRIPLESLTMIQGDGAVGKSTLLRWLAARVTRGDLPGDLSGPGDVLWLNVEEHAARDIRPGIDRQGGDPSRVHLIDGAALSLPRDLPRLTDAVARIQPKMIILDQTNAVIETRLVREALVGLRQLAEDHGCAVILNRNLNGSMTSAYRAGRGGAIYTDVSRAAYQYGLHPEDDHHGRRVLAPIKQNSATANRMSLIIEIDDAGQLVMAGEDDIPADMVLCCGGKGGQTEASRLDDAVAWLANFLDGREVPTKELEAAALADGISLMTLQRARSVLGTVARKVGKRWVVGRAAISLN